jgi:type IV pilus assembly protein PilC
MATNPKPRNIKPTVKPTVKPAGIREYVYIWRGKDREGKKISGELRATGENLVRSALRRRGIVLTSLKKQKLKRGKKITEKDIALFTRQLSTMMRAGVPMLQSFDIVAKGHGNANMTRLLNNIKSEVEVGNTLQQAFRKYPQHFDPLFVNLIGAGEQAGILDLLLDRLATYKEKTLAIKGKVKSAMFYPIAVLAVAFIVTTVIMIFVIPAFKDIFSGFGAELPYLTLVVISISDFMVKWGWLIAFVLMAFTYFFFQAWKRSPAVSAFMDRLLLQIPIFGELIRKSSISRWSRTLSTMFAAGVPLIEALDSVGGASGNDVYLQATREIQNEISTGMPLAAAMQNTGEFDNLVVQMTAIGEQSGALEEMLSKAADFYDREVDEMVDSLSSLLEPMIMVFLGVLIGGLVVAMYLPIFKLGEVVAG